MSIIVSLGPVPTATPESMLTPIGTMFANATMMNDGRVAAFWVGEGPTIEVAVSELIQRVREQPDGPRKDSKGES